MDVQDTTPTCRTTWHQTHESERSPKVVTVAHSRFGSKNTVFSWTCTGPFLDDHPEAASAAPALPVSAAAYHLVYYIPTNKLLHALLHRSGRGHCLPPTAPRERLLLHLRRERNDAKQGQRPRGIVEEVTVISRSRSHAGYNQKKKRANRSNRPVKQTNRRPCSQNNNNNNNNKIRKQIKTKIKIKQKMKQTK